MSGTGPGITFQAAERIAGSGKCWPDSFTKLKAEPTDGPFQGNEIKSEKTQSHRAGTGIQRPLALQRPVPPVSMGADGGGLVGWGGRLAPKHMAVHCGDGHLNVKAWC